MGLPAEDIEVGTVYSSVRGQHKLVLNMVGHGKACKVTYKVIKACAGGSPINSIKTVHIGQFALWSTGIII